MIHFNCTNVKDYEVDEAVLNLHLHEIDNSSSDFGLDENFSINLNVSRVVKNRQGILTKALFTNNWIKLSRKKLKAGAWLKVDVTHMVVETFKHHNELAIVVKVQDSMNRTNLMVSHQGSESSLSLTPYIQLTLKDNAHKRTRRTVGMDCTENSREVRCCRYPLEVNFEAFGWDWIIAPKVYEANYCSGECPYSFLQKYPHTHLVHLAAPEGSGGPCCTPRRMSSISMLYFDHNFNIIYGTIPGMVVESCGCS